MDKEALAKLIVEEIHRQAQAGRSTIWCNEDLGFDDVNIDGHIDILAVASVVLNAIQPVHETSQR